MNSRHCRISQTFISDYLRLLYCTWLIELMTHRQFVFPYYGQREPNKRIMAPEDERKLVRANPGIKVLY